MLQSEAGYIDARPHVRQLDEILLQRTAGPYMWVRSVGLVPFAIFQLHSQELTSSGHSTTAASCQLRP